MNLSFAHPWLLSTVLERKYSAPMVLFNVCQISGPVLRLSLSTQQAAAQNIWRTKAVFVWFALHLLWLLCLFPSNICATSEKPVIVGKTPVSHRPYQKAFDGEYLPQEFFFSFSLTRFIFFSHLPCKKKKKNETFSAAALFWKCIQILRIGMYNICTFLAFWISNLIFLLTSQFRIPQPQR